MKLHYLLALLLIIGACTTTELQTGNQDAVEDADAQNDNAQADSQESGSQDDATEEFNELFAQRNQEWKIAYDITSSAQGEQMSMKTTQYIKGENIRMDMAVQGMESRTYIVDEVFTMCTSSGGDWSCYKSEPSEDDAAVEATEWEDSYEEDASQYRITSDGTKVVAGVTAQCFKITEIENTAAAVRYCFSDDGAPLYVYMADGEDTTEMIATSYSSSVASSDFVPPAEAQDMGAMYGGTQPAGSGADGACSYCNYLSGSDRDECLASC